MSNGIRSIPRYQEGGGVTDKLKGLWSSIRRRADDIPLPFLMMPGVGEAADLIEIGAGLQDRSPGRVGLGIAGLTLPFVGASALRKILKARKKLPMDQASRMARAKKMGFDLKLYHGTDEPLSTLSPVKRAPQNLGFIDSRATSYPQDVDWTTLKPGPEPGMWGRGIYLGNKGLADIFTEKSDILGADWIHRSAFPRIYPGMVRSKKLLEVGSDEYKAVLRRSPAFQGTEATSSLIDFGSRGEQIADAARKAGYEGLVDNLDDPTMVSIFESKNIRSPWATFDPAESESADLLAGIGGLLGLGMAGKGYSRALAEDQMKEGK